MSQNHYNSPNGPNPPASPMDGLDFAHQYLRPMRMRDGKIIPELCPICHGGSHGDRETFALYQDETGRWVYKCQRASCPDGLGTLRHLMDIMGVRTAPRKVREPAFQSLLKSKRLYALPPSSELNPATEAVYAFFAARKISRATVDAFGIGASPSGMIAFPFYENGILTYLKYRRPAKYVKSEGYPKEKAFPKAKPILFHLEKTDPNLELIITEGQIDAMALYEAGITNVASVPSGANNNEWIENDYPKLERYPSILLFGDSDEPGRKAVAEWVRRLGPERCRVVEDYPMRGGDSSIPCKDANEVLYFCGPEKLREMVERAEPASMPGLVDMADVPMFDPVAAHYIPSSIASINREVGGYLPGDLVLWTGKTGEGKTTVVSQEILSAMEAGEKIVWYNAELMPPRVKRSIILQAVGGDYVGVRFDPRRGREVPYVAQDCAERVSEWMRGKIYLCEDNVSELAFDSDYLLKLFGYARRRLGCTVAVVDNVMTALMGAPDNAYLRAQENFAAALKKLATSLAMTVHLVAHPRKTRESLTTDDVAGSASLTRLCDLSIAVSHGKMTVLKDRSEGNQNLSIPFVYYPDTHNVTDLMNDVPLACSWDRRGIQKPELPASSLYPKIVPPTEYPA